MWGLGKTGGAGTKTAATQKMNIGINPNKMQNTQTATKNEMFCFLLFP